MATPRNISDLTPDEKKQIFIKLLTGLSFWEHIDCLIILVDHIKEGR